MAENHNDLIAKVTSTQTEAIASELEQLLDASRTRNDFSMVCGGDTAPTLNVVSCSLEDITSSLREGQAIPLSEIELAIHDSLEAGAASENTAQSLLDKIHRLPEDTMIQHHPHYVSEEHRTGEMKSRLEDLASRTAYDLQTPPDILRVEDSTAMPPMSNPFSHM